MGAVVPISSAYENRLINQIQEIARDSKRVFWPDALRKETRKARVTNLQAQKCIMEGEFVEPPALDEWGQWAGKIQSTMSGNRVQVSLSIVTNEEDPYLVVTAVTVIFCGDFS